MEECSHCVSFCLIYGELGVRLVMVFIYFLGAEPQGLKQALPLCYFASLIFMS